MTEICFMPTATLVDAYKRKTLSPVDVTKAVLDRIDNRNKAVNAISFCDPELTLLQAKQSEKRWLNGSPLSSLDGVPTTIKDVFAVKGWPLSMGSLTTVETPGEFDAPAVARLREAGALFIGMTTTPEFGWKGVTDNPRNGLTRNPHDLSLTSGGSSGGAAVAAFEGMGALHLGSDGGGSIRMPASFVGVFGLKPSYGRVPAFPASPFATVSHVGPIARSVADAAAMMAVITQPDPRGWDALPYDDKQDWNALPIDFSGYKIGFATSIGSPKPTPDIQQSFIRTLDKISAAGAVLIDLTEELTRIFERAPEVFKILWSTGAAQLLTGIDSKLHSKMDTGLVELANAGKHYSGCDVVWAQMARRDMGRALSLLQIELPYFMLPTLPVLPFAVGREVPEGFAGSRWYDWAINTYAFNLTRNPACSLPCDKTESGLPVGFQIVGPKFGDGSLLRVARTVEKLTENF